MKKIIILGIQSCLLAVLALPVFAQEVEFEIPSEIDIVQGRLSVVFEHGVGEEEALQLIRSAGYEIIDVQFSPLVVSGTLTEQISAETIQLIESEATVYSTTIEGSPGAYLAPSQDSENLPRPIYVLITTFTEDISEVEAGEILSNYVAMRNVKIDSIPNEVIIEVGDRDEEAIAQLQGLKQIQWVTYIGISTEH